VAASAFPEVEKPGPCIAISAATQNGTEQTNVTIAIAVSLPARIYRRFADP